MIYALLLGVKALSRRFYRYEIRWIDPVPADPWEGLKLVLILNHTSLYEPLFAGWVPRRFLRQVAVDGLVPVADKTLNRPFVGKFFKVIAGNVISLSRTRDVSWGGFLEQMRPSSLVVMLPEGRMKRAGGLDSEGAPMTVRGGVADLLQIIGAGRMLIAYSGGLHHVQVPGQLLPKPFKALSMTVESFEIRDYIHHVMAHRRGLTFKQAVIRDLENRRNRHCP
jgi:1-acyl-sn-glycerol-3-phosphate acyltransferase